MGKKLKNCLVGQSGGPTAAINSSLAGLINRVQETESYDTIYGMVNGVEGLIDGRFLNLSEIFDTKESIETLSKTPAMYLGSCRYKLPTGEEDAKLYNQLFETLYELDIQTFFYIGGNDSMDTVLKLSNYAKKHNIDIQFIGIPKTIDNDLPTTDHTPGYGSAAKYVATSLLNVAHDTYIYNMPTVTIVEIMGRNAGWLTAAASLARNEYNTSPDLIYLPEARLSRKTFIEDVKALQSKKHKNIIIAVSEGAKDENGEYLSISSRAVDSFGHKMLSGASTVLEDWIIDDIGCKARSIILNVLQRCGGHIASKTDLEEAAMIGAAAVDLSLTGETGKMVAFKRISNDPYKIEIVSSDVAKVANKEKKLPANWVSDNQSDVTQDFVDYAKPLIQGEVPLVFKDGLPVYSNVRHLKKWQK